MESKISSFCCYLKSVIYEKTLEHLVLYCGLICRVEICSVMLTLSSELKSVNVKTCSAVLGFWGLLSFPVFCPCYHEVSYWLIFSFYLDKNCKLCCQAVFKMAFVFPILHSQNTILSGTCPQIIFCVLSFIVPGCCGLQYFSCGWIPITR